MELNLAIQPKDISGNDIPGPTLGELIADFFASETKGDALKLWGWAIKLKANETLNLDLSDKRLIKDVLISSDRIFVQFKAQVLLAIDKEKA